MKHKKLISIALCFMLTITLLVTKPIKAKAEIDVRQSLIATLVISLINMGINVTTEVIEPYITKWAINVQDYAEELSSQFDNVKDALIVGFKTLTLAKRIQSDLLRQGLKNNGSITITTGTPSINYTNGEFTLGDIILQSNKNNTTITYNATQSTESDWVKTVPAYYIIPVNGEQTTYNFPNLSYSSTYMTATPKTYLLMFKTDEKLERYLNILENQNFTSTGSGRLKWSYIGNPPDYADYDRQISYDLQSANISTPSLYKYILILHTLEFNYPKTNGQKINLKWSINIPENNNAINMGAQETTVTAGTIDTANWSNINKNYTYEMIIESNNQIVNSNQALIDAINSNTQSITQSQVIDTTTSSSVEDIKTNVWGISSILEGIKSTFQTLVKPITDIFNKTYTLEEINTLSWVNVMNELVTTIETGVANIIPYYKNYVGNYLQGISHPQANILTTTVNDILVNTNLSWAVYAISVILLVKGVIL